MAARLGVTITGNERDLLRAFKSSERGARQFDREMGRATRGALRGSGAFKGLGHSVAFASGTFLGAAGLTEALRASVDAAEEFGKASRSLNAQLRANKENVKDAAPAIELANAKLARFGQTAADSETALSRLDRATGNIRKAIQLESLTANVAAARHISLAQAALLVGKVVQGTTTALNRGGLVIKKGTSVTEALRIATEKFAGQAAASVTPLEKFHASVFNLEIILGEGLLPTINKVADALSKWLSQPVNQERVRTDVEETAHAFGTLASAIGDVAHAFGKLKALEQKVPAHSKGLFELTADALGQQAFLPKQVRDFFARKGTPGVLGPTAPVSRPATSTFTPPGLQGPVMAAGGGRTGFTAQGNKFFDAALGRRLDRVQDVRTLRGQVSALTQIAGLVKQRLAKTKDVTRIATLEDDLVDVFRRRAGIRGQIAANAKAAAIKADESILARLGFGVDKASATANLNDDIAALNVLAAALRKQIKEGGDVLALEQQLFGVTQQITDARRQQIERASAKRAQARERLAAANAKGQAQTVAKQFAALGLGPTGGERVPTAAQLRNQLGTVENALKGTVLDTAANRKIISGVRKDLSGELGKLNADVRSKIKELLDALTPDKQALEGTLFHKTSPNALLEGLGLSAKERRALRGRLSQVGAGGTVHGSGGGAFGVADRDIVVHSPPIYLDGWQLTKGVTKRQQTRTRRNPPQKRGPNAGR